MKISEPLNKFNKINFKYSVTKGFISVIIPVYKDVRGLEDTLKSLGKQTLPNNLYEIIVANDGADKEITKLCNSYNVKEIKISPNGGSYNARNKALEISKGEFLAFTDADVIVPNSWIMKGIVSLSKSDYAGGPIKFIATKKNNLSDLYENLFDFNIQDSFTNHNYCVTANLFVKRSIMESVGGFDSRLKSGGDNEFGNRIHLAKLKQVYDPNNYITHPHRNYSQIIIKKNRVGAGLNDLVRLYPNRYKRYTYVLIDDIINIFIPPFKYINTFPFFLYLWHMKIIDLYINIKYRHKNMQIFNDKSKFQNIIIFLKNLTK